MPGFFRQFFKKFNIGACGNEAPCDMTELRLIIGLGNPGKEYVGTRHNVGFEVIDGLSKQLGIEVRKKKFGGRFGRGVYAGLAVALLKPEKYMNLSGQVVATAVGFYKLPLENILVVSDDMALKPGRVRIRKKGSSGGHKGLEDIISKLGSDEFGRLRTGIGSSDKVDARDYVLSKVFGEDSHALERGLEQSQEAVLCWVSEGIDVAMNKYNIRNNV